MKTSAQKSSTTTSKTAAQRSSSQPFFAKAGSGDFFAPAVQMKMAVNRPGDKFEQEADKMADKVMRMPAPAAGKEEKLQRQPEEKLQKKEEDKIQKATMPEEKLQKAAVPEEKVQKKEEEKIQKAGLPEEKIQKAAMPEEKLQKAALPEEKVQKKEEEKLQRKGSDSTPVVNSNVQSAIRDKTSSGQPLSSEVRRHMEPRFGADFSNIRIHSDTEAAALCNQLNARAFTYQNHIFFSRGQYQPGTNEGKQLLAHELTHTLQQGHAVQRKAGLSVSEKRDEIAPTIQKAPAAAGNETASSSGVVDLSSNVFNPPQNIRDEIEAQGSKGLYVRVSVKGLTGEGRVKIKADSSKNYDSMLKGSMPLINPWAHKMGGMYVNFNVKNGEINGGYASLTAGGGNTNEWLQSLQKNASLLGGLGLKIDNLPKPVNKFENGKLTLGVTNLKVEVGGYVDALFNLALENNNKPKIDASADITIKGIVKGQLKLNNNEDKLVGQVSLAVDYKSFSGAALVKYNAEGTVDVEGKAAYNANKLSGEIQFVATDLDAANSFAKDAISAAGGKENVQNAAAPAPVPVPKAGKKQRALAATGQLGFNLTTWFAGTVNVVVDGKGAITVIGKIAPPAEIELFKQRDWDKQLIMFEAKAYYGIPVVGNLNLFANISLHALAKLGPAKIYNIEILGTYSTDPDIQKNIQISGSINISAYAGLRLRAEGGAGIEIVSHDLKFGVGIQADVGVKAYADARPTIGYRDPGVFYISGTLEMVAQPMLGLGGDFFIAIETPWWSPLSDDRWTWPLFSKEWPLTDPIGLSATVKDYALGSGVAPEIELKKPEFDPSKFMTSMVDKTLPDKSGGQGSGQGTFKEDGSVPKPTVPPKKPEPKKVDAKPGKKGAPPKGGKSGAPDPKAAKDQDATKTLKSSLDALKSKAPYSKTELDKALAAIKGKVKGVSFTVQAQGEKWIITPSGGGKKKSEGKIELAKKKDDELHKKIGQEVAKKLSQPAKSKSYDVVRKEKESIAKDLIKENNPKLEKTIKLSIKFKDKAEDQKDNDIDFHIHIGPNDFDMDAAIEGITDSKEATNLDRQGKLATIDDRQAAIVAMQAIATKASPGITVISQLSDAKFTQYKNEYIKSYAPGKKEGDNFQWPYFYLRLRAARRHGFDSETLWRPIVFPGSSPATFDVVRLDGSTTQVIPDVLTSSKVGDIKNWASLSFTQQLQDFALIANPSSAKSVTRNGRPYSAKRKFEVAVRHETHTQGETSVSGPLQTAVTASDGKVHFVITDHAETIDDFKSNKNWPKR
jgi:hypothetical protein